MAVIPATIIFAVRVFMNQSKAESIRSTLENYRIHEKAKRKKIEWYPLNCHLFMFSFVLLFHPAQLLLRLLLFELRIS